MAVTTVAPSGVVAPSLDLSALWSPNFPSPDLVKAAAGLLTPLPSWDGREGPRSRIVIAPGVIAVSQRDPARADRAHEREVKTRQTRANLAAVQLLNGEPEEARRTGACVTSWSAKSRARMVKVLGQLDYAPLFDGGGVPAMLTLTYPGEWESVAPNAAAATKHVRAFAERFQRHYGKRLVGVWKREFQRRGAPHYHILMVPPAPVDGESFRAWASRNWAAVVAHPDPEQRRRHERAGTGLDYAEGMRAKDPKRLAVYFSKHGSYADKEYQNEAPALWVESGSVGRYWGVWGLDKAIAEVEVTRDQADATARVLRRWARANGYVAPREVWRSSDREVDTETGEVQRKWRRRKVRRRVKRMPGRLGFVMVNDGPAFVSQLARYLDTI